MPAAAQQTLGAFLGAETARCTTLEPIQGGQSTAKLFKFSHDDKSYVLRLLAPASSRERHDHEVQLTRAAGDIGVGPRVHFIAADASAIIYDYTPGHTLSLEDTGDAAVLKSLAQRLGRLHCTDVDIPPATSPFERFYGYEERMIAAGGCWPQAMRQAAEYVRHVEGELQPVTGRPSHLDLHAHNIILAPTGEPVFIDWVNGGLSDAGFDVATLIVFLGLQDRSRDHFLNSYQQEMGESLDMARVERLMPIRPFVAAASSLVNIPAEVSLTHLEQEMARDQLPGHVLHSVEHSARPAWPRWKWGLVALRMGLSHLP